MDFEIPDTLNMTKAFYDEYNKRKTKVAMIYWFTNLDHNKRHEKLILCERYYDDNGNPVANAEEKWPHYDNYDAINIDKVKDIPVDYYGIMGVPITFIDKYNPDQFEILGSSRYHDNQDFADDISVINGKAKYMRLLIRRKREDE